MTYDEMITFSWRIFDISIITAEALGWVAFIIGGLGLVATRSNPATHRRFKGLFLGGGMALVSVLFVGGFYEATAYIMTGHTEGIEYAESMYPNLYLEQFSDDKQIQRILDFSGTFSQLSAVVGMAATTFGTGLWGVTKHQSIFRSKAKKITYAGFALMALSVSERAFAAIVHVFISIIFG